MKIISVPWKPTLYWCLPVGKNLGQAKKFGLQCPLQQCTPAAVITWRRSRIKPWDQSSIQRSTFIMLYCGWKHHSFLNPKYQQQKTGGRKKYHIVSLRFHCFGYCLSQQLVMLSHAQICYNVIFARNVGSMISLNLWVYATTNVTVCLVESNQQENVCNLLLSVFTKPLCTQQNYWILRKFHAKIQDS